VAEAPKVFIAGATSAIAQATARLYARRGARFFLVARDPLKLEAVASDLTGRGAAQVASAVADLDDLARHPGLVEEGFAALGGIDVALIAHGTLPDQASCQAEFASTHAALVNNFLGAASLAAGIINASAMTF